MTTIQASIGKMHLGTVVLALAASAVTSCADGKSNTVAKSDLATIVGNWPVYGDLPNGGAEQSNHGETLEFKPAYDAVLYLQFGEGAHVTAKHAFFETVVNFPGGSDDERREYEVARLQCAINVLATGKESKICPEYDENINDNKPMIFEDFFRFRFGSQQRLYIFVDNKDIAFNRAAPVAFTPLGAMDAPSLGVNKKDRNLSFYDQRYIEDLIGSQDAVVLNNYFTGRDGKKIDKINGSSYSLNINLLSCRSPNSNGNCDFSSHAEVIPLVIDPDTGNGWGYGP